MSLIEALANVAVGYAVAVATQMPVFPLLAPQVSLLDLPQLTEDQPAHRPFAAAHDWRRRPRSMRPTTRRCASSTGSCSSRSSIAT
jgi:hypothetical protein